MKNLRHRIIWWLKFLPINPPLESMLLASFSTASLCIQLGSVWQREVCYPGSPQGLTLWGDLACYKGKADDDIFLVSFSLQPQKDLESHLSFTLLPWHMIFVGGEPVMQVPAGCNVLGAFQIPPAKHRVLLSRTFSCSSVIGISFTIQWSFIGTNIYWPREGDKKHTKRAEWNTSSPLRMGCWLSCSSLVTHRRWRDSRTTGDSLTFDRVSRSFPGYETREVP